jgi:hypothetical protein
MGTILPFIKEQPVFDPEATHVMSTAFDAVCLALQLPEHDTRSRETVAIRIIELVRRGISDPELLRQRLLREAGTA